MDEASDMVTLVENHDCVGNALGTRCKHPNNITAIRIQDGAGVPAVVGVRGPRGPVAGLFMDKDADARWCMGVRLKSN